MKSNEINKGIINKIVDFLEKDRFNILTAYFYILGLGILRTLLEGLFFGGEINLRKYFHLTNFFFVSFLLGVLALFIASKEKIKNIVNFALCGFWIIVPSPIIDHFIFGRRTQYFYIPRKKISEAVTSFFFLSEGIGKALIIEFLIFIVMSIIYVYVKRRNILQAVLAGFLVYLAILGMCVHPLIPIIKHGFSIGLWYFILSVFLCVLLAYMHDEKVTISIMKNTRPIRSFNFIFMVFIGLVVSKAFNLRITPYEIYKGDLHDISNLIQAILPIFLAWQYAIIVNDIYDEKIDQISNSRRPFVSGLVSREQYVRLAILICFLSMYLGILLGFFSFAIMVVFLLTANLYSVPPFRLRKYIFSTCFLGFWSSISYLHGLVLYTSPIDSEKILIALFIFVVITVGTIAKDLKDYEGDKISNISNFFTIFGREKGKKIVSGIVFFTFLLPMTYFRGLIDILVILFFALTVMLFFYRLEKLELSLLCYFFVAAYCLLRYEGILQPVV